MNKHDKKHLKRLEAIARMVERIYDAAADDAAAIGAMAMRLGADGEVPFSFDDYPQAKARMDELLSWLRSQLEVVVAEGVAGEWQLSEDKNDELVRRVLGIMGVGDSAAAQGEGDAGTLPDAIRRRWLDRNEKGREAFLKRKERGLGLSERVWRGTQSFPSEIAMGIDMGILDGKPAASMARDLKQYLKHPDKLFRRVRDERGILHLSKNAAAFHPGQGVYRSSYQNARRLAVTETNMAYRTADHERWQQLDFVVGIEIHLSGNHTCKGRDGKPHKFEDICDQLRGKYPKDFKFTGWHPHCRCYATSILKTEEELDEDMRKTMAGEPVDGESVNKVEEPPKEFSDWMEKNEGRIKEAKTLPYFLKDNPIYINSGGQEFHGRKKGIFKNSNSIGSRSAEKEARAIYREHNSIVTLDQKQIDNAHEIKRLIKDRAKLSPMSFEDADDGNANIHNFDNGCVNAVFALEARRRGINCTSRGLVNEVSKDQEYVNLWTTKSGKRPSLQILRAETNRIKSQEQIYAQLIKRVDELTKAEGTRYSLAWTDYESYQLYKNKVIKWGEVEGHIVYMERIGGKLLIHDEQGNTFCNLKSILQIAEIENTGLEVLRLDNLLINTRNRYLSKVIELYP